MCFALTIRAALFQCYAPDLHAYYGDTMDKLYEWNPALLRNFSHKVSVFAAATFNFGPRTVTFPHLDFANLAWGWCAITALGDFDPDRSGHLILWDLKLIIRFPPGSTILIPSALIRHSNTSIQAHENASHSRSTHLQESSASDQLVNDLGVSVAERAARLEARKTRWVEGLKMYRRRNVAAN
ncbi:hypothetical protein B0H14DRAFT_3099804 [Mycena olivaceomarginata]|nr:hypothetical protein B0H14DRAFT_3099804 [Mycena olivaceomarginata]